MAKHREDVATVIMAAARERPEVHERVAFGVPGFFVGGKMFACVNRNGLALKLPPATIEQLTGPEFGPFGRENHPMRGWVLITRENAADYQRDEPLFDASIAYVAAQAAETPAKPARAARRRTSAA